MASYPCPHCGEGTVREDRRGVGVCDACGAEILDRALAESTRTLPPEPLPYSVFLWWSAEEHRWLAEIAELPGAIAGGATRAEALAEAELLADTWSEMARDRGRGMPPALDSPSALEALREAHRRRRPERS
jgi:predicted RNase H-like HicB family nuclease